eukprot:scaffold11693_cov116-Skeletonema_dohrnii-CCMP3373.AAC.1
MVSRKRNKGKTRRALKAEKERFAKAKAEAERAKAAEAEIAVRLMREREEAAAAAATVECESHQNTVDAKKNLFGSEDISPDEADDAGAKLVILTRKRRGLVTSFSRYDSLNRFYCEGTCVRWLNECGSKCMHGLVPCTRLQPPGFINAFIHEFNLIYGRLHVLYDRDVVAFACKALLAAFKFTQEKYDTVWNDRANLNWTVSFFLANGTQHLLDENDSCARDCAFISYAFEQRAAVFVNQSRTINWPKLLELYIADHHTLLRLPSSSFGLGSFTLLAFILTGGTIIVALVRFHHPATVGTGHERPRATAHSI